MAQHLRKYSNLPVVIVDNHNEVVHCIHRAIASKHLPFLNTPLIHLDAHPDLSVPLEMPAEQVYNKEALLGSIDIENWIMPLAYAGHINRVTWIKPEWSSQIDEKVSEIVVGQCKESHTIRVDCDAEYYLTDGTYSPTTELLNQRSLMLSTHTLSLSHFQSNHQNIVDSLNMMIAAEPYILDIDLDFFSTQNPFTDEYTETQKNILKKLFSFELCASSTCNSYEISQKRRSQLSSLQDLFYAFKTDSQTHPAQHESALLKELINDLEHEDKEIDLDLLYNAGLVFGDGIDLPHHISTDEEIEKLVSQVQHILRDLPKPTIVTIARSTNDDYCPSHQTEHIQSSVLTMLSALYPNIDVKYAY